MVTHVPFDDRVGGAVSARPRTGEDVQSVDRGLTVVGHLDDATEQCVAPVESDAHVGLSSNSDRGPRIEDMDPIGECPAVAAGDDDVCEREPVVGLLVAALQVQEGVVGGREQCHAQEDGEPDAQELPTLATQVATNLPAENAHVVTSSPRRPTAVVATGGPRRRVHRGDG